jgi:protein-S-isoprenylcysteine O-methyltransferase Ste14
MTKPKAIIASYVGVLLFASVIFLAAWKILYCQGLLYVVIALVGTTLSHVLAGRGSDLLVERTSKIGAGQMWDKRILGACFAATIVTFVTAGLDSGRFGWTGRVPLGITITGVVLMLVGQVLFAVAKRVNNFFSSTVRIQSDRGHKVCDQGPYRYVRHPGYLGMLVSLLAFPLLINSYWAFIPASASAILLIVRTAMEDQFLTQQLPGYRDYAAKTRWKLLPGVF